jgi:hypothetical protein
MLAHTTKATAVLAMDKTEHIMYSCAVILSNMSAMAGVHQQVVLTSSRQCHAPCDRR